MLPNGWARVNEVYAAFLLPYHAARGEAPDAVKPWRHANGPGRLIGEPRVVAARRSD
jgi:hypothetical protein